MIGTLYLVFLLGPTPLLTLPATISTTCICSDGTQLNIGDPLHRLTDCSHCSCSLEGMREVTQACPKPQCADYYSKEGDGICCPSCPNGPNCKVVEDIIGLPGPVPDGEVVNVGHAICSCDVNDFDGSTQYPIAECVFPPPEITCTCNDGTVIGLGDSHRISDCDLCYCDEQHGAEILPGCCLPWKDCVDYVDVEGDGFCCPHCPNGKNCRAEVGGKTTIIPHGKVTYFNGGECYCNAHEPFAIGMNGIPIAVCNETLNFY